MPYSAASMGHDSSLDDAGLHRRCEQRIATFPDCSQEFSITSADTSFSGPLPANSATGLDTSGENRSDDSFLARTDKRDPTFFENTSVNRNPCQENRRWAEWTGCRFPTHCQSLEQNPSSKDLVSNCTELVQQKKKSNPSSAPKCTFISSGRCATQQKADNASSSDSSPIVDNLILEPELNLKQTSEKRSAQRRRVAKCVQIKDFTSNMCASRETSAHNYENRKQTSHVCKQQSGKSLPGKPEQLDPTSEVYLKKLDNILQKMDTKSERQPWTVSEKLGRPVSSIPVSKTSKPSLGRRSCNCACRPPVNGKLNGETSEVRKVGNFRNKAVVRQDLPKPESSLAAPRSVARARCPRADKRKHAAAGSSVGKDLAFKQPAVTNSLYERSVGSSKVRSKSLSVPTRCHLHDSANSCTAPVHRSIKSNSCEATDYGRKCGSVDPGNLSKQQIEILRHIPGDLTPDEAGTVLQTVLSILEQRHCVKSCTHGDDCFRKDLRAATESDPDVLSKYETDSMSDSCYMSTSLSPKSKLCLSDRQKETVGGGSLANTRCDAEALNFLDDSSSAERQNHGENNSLISEVFRMEPAASELDLESCDQTKADQLQRAKFNSSSRNLSASSARNNFQCRPVAGQPGAHQTEKLPKKSAIVLPFEDKFTRQSRQPPAECFSQESCSSQLLSPVSHDVPDQHGTQTDGPQRQQRGLSSVPTAGCSAVSRHIGWKYPLHTHTDGQCAASDTADRDGPAHSSITDHGPEHSSITDHSLEHLSITDHRREHSSITDHAALARSHSTLSDGLLYSRSTRIPKAKPPQEISRNNFPLSAALPGSRRQSGYCVGSQQRPVGGNQLGPSSTSQPAGMPERRPFLLPCPHGSEHRGQTFTCQTSTNVGQTQDSHKSELDQVIEELRADIRNNYNRSIDPTHPTGSSAAVLVNENTSRANFLLPHSKSVQERLNKYVQIETRAKGQHQREVTYLDNISSSDGAVLTNSVFRSRMGLSEEYPCMNMSQVRSVARDQPARSALLFQNDLHRNHQWTSSLNMGQTAGGARFEAGGARFEAGGARFEAGGARFEAGGARFEAGGARFEAGGARFEAGGARFEAGGTRFETNMTSAFLQQTDRQPTRRADGNQPITYTAAREATGEICRDSLTELLALPSTTLSRLLPTESGGFRIPNESLCSKDGATNYHRNNYGCDLENQGGQVGHTYSQMENTSAVRFRNLASSETSGPCGNVESFSGMASFGDGNRSSCMEPRENAEQKPSQAKPSSSDEPINVLNPYNVDKVPRTAQSPVRMDLAQPSGPRTEAGQLGNINPPTIRDSPSSSHFSKSLEPPKIVEQRPNLDPRPILKSPTKSQTPINVKTHSTIKSPTKMGSTPSNNIFDKATEEAISPDSTEDSKNSDLAQLKQSTESLLAEVYRKYYADMLAPNMECARTADLATSLQFLQNFSPIRQVDVNTQYPVTIDNENQLSSTEIKKNKETQVTAGINNSSKPAVLKLSNQKQTTIVKTTAASQKSSKMVSKLPHSNMRRQNSSRVSYKDMNKQALQIQRSNSNSAGTSSHEKPLREAQTLSTPSQCSESKTDVLLPDTVELLVEGTELTIMDVTSFHNDICPVKLAETEPESERVSTDVNLVVKTYTSRSAVPVDVKVIRKIDDRKVLSSEDATRLSSGPRFQAGSKIWAPVVVCGADASRCQHKGVRHGGGMSDRCQACTSDRCQACTVASSNCASSSAARRKLSSGVKNAGKCADSDSSMASVSCDDVEADKDNCVGDCNNSCSWSSRRDENDSASTHRPSSKILGELAFQLERRILDYVFGVEGSRQRRFYGYTVNNICQMMSKECKNMCGVDDPIRKSELAFRLKKLLIGLKKVGYDIKVHGDFAQQMVNNYGLLPCPPDACTIEQFGLHNVNCISCLIEQLATDEYEHNNLYILLHSLQYLSKCDRRPLFVW